MTFQTVTPPQAKQLLDSDEPWTYVDVRTQEEFEAKHPAGAFNIPLALRDPETGGMRPNPDFLEVVQRRFPGDARLILGCAAGGRSLAACRILEEAGFTQLVNMHGGFSGAREPDGTVSEPGWEAHGYPVESEAPAEHTWVHLQAPS